MNPKTPHFQNLYSFYQAAELGSFKMAAEQQYITSAAISQQIRQLEEQLDVKLFERQHRKVVLTAEGKVLLDYARQGFTALQNGVRQLSQDQNPNSLSLSALPSFSQDWLVPRLGSFSELYPNLSVLIMSKNALADFSREQIDLCVRFGAGEYDGLRSEFLMADHLYPVCHPLYVKEHNIKSLNDLPNVRLIEDARPDMSWKYWLELAGIDMPSTIPSLRYSGAHMVLEGALSVQGVALVRHSLAWKFIEQGLLVKIGDIEVRSSFGYWLCAPPPYFKRDKVIHFTDWIKQQADEFWQNSQKGQSNSRTILDANTIKPE